MKRNKLYLQNLSDSQLAKLQSNSVRVGAAIDSRFSQYHPELAQGLSVLNNKQKAHVGRYVDRLGSAAEYEMVSRKTGIKGRKNINKYAIDAIEKSYSRETFPPYQSWAQDYKGESGEGRLPRKRDYVAELATRMFDRNITMEDFANLPLDAKRQPRKVWK